jgi:hypothetical protein
MYGLAEKVVAVDDSKDISTVLETFWSVVEEHEREEWMELGSQVQEISDCLSKAELDAFNAGHCTKMHYQQARHHAWKVYQRLSEGRIHIVGGFSNRQDNVGCSRANHCRISPGITVCNASFKWCFAQRP